MPQVKRWRMPSRYAGGRGVLEPDPSGEWVQTVAGPEEDIEALPEIPPEVFAALGEASMRRPPQAEAPPVAPEPRRAPPVRKPGVSVEMAQPGPGAPEFQPLAQLAPMPGAAAPPAATPPGPMAGALRMAGAAAQNGVHPVGGTAEDVRAAFEAADRRRLGASLARAGSMIGAAIGGTQPSPAFAQLEAEADRPIQEAQAMREARTADVQAEREGEKFRLQMGGAEREEQRQVSEADPGSLESQVARRLFERMLGQAAPENMSAAQLKEQFPWAVKILDTEAEMARARSSAADRALARQLSGFERDVQRAGKDLEKLSELEADMRHMEQIANAPEGEDIPGIGVADSRMPDWALSREGLENRQSTMRAVVALLRAVSGAAVTPTEAQRFMTARGWGFGAPEKAWRAGVKAFLRDTRRQLIAQQSKYRPEVIKTLKERGGFTAESIPGGGATQRSGMVRIRDTSTGRMGWADPQDVPPGAEVVR